MREANAREGRTGKTRKTLRPRPNKSGKGLLPSTRPGAPAGVVYLDAEDIAMARLHASLRRAEAIPAEVPVAATGLGRITVRLSRDLLNRTRDRAARDGATVSEVIAHALERFLRGR